MTKDTVDPSLLELDDEAPVEEWIISKNLGIPSAGGSGVSGNPNGDVLARALDSTKRPGQIASGCEPGS